MKRAFFTIILILVFLITTLTTGVSSTAAESPLQIMASFNAIAEMVQAIGGEHVEVSTMIPAGAATHGYEPKAGDLRTLQNADLLVINGLNMEPWADQAIEAIHNDRLIVVDTSVDVDLLPLGEDEERDHDHAENEDPDTETAMPHDHADDEYDPHIWLGFTTAMVQASTIRDALIAADPVHERDYNENAEAFIGALQAILDEYSPQIADTENKSFVVGHAAFAYLCRDLDLIQNSVQSVFAEGEPSARQLVELVEYSREHDVTTIFSEKLASPDVSRTLADEVGATVEMIYTMETEEDDLSYLERMEMNVVKILASLQP